MVYRIVHEIYEPEGPSPDVAIVLHIFQGKTQDEAYGYFNAHLTTDSFFRGAVENGSWNGMPLETRLTACWV